ncbi:MAG TPA: haloacid dehalogenase type II [Terriglobales bacterium]|jgi:2-haloacid dehalogenase|nr:haloacid dehalogenase type II [Terriglobales bacterium]
MAYCLALDFSRFRIITFDCYGTLIDWESGILSAIRPILSAHGAHLSDPEILRMYGEIEAHEESGEYQPYREILQAVVRGFGTRLGFGTSEQEQQSLPDSLASWKPFSDTVTALRQLKQKFKLGILSNIDEDLFAATAQQLAVDFDYVITASQARAYKPSLEIFRLAQKRMGLPGEKWLHAAQSIYHDVIPAQSLGISTVWVNRPSPSPNSGAAKPAQAKPDIEVSSLHALADLVNK